MCRLTASAERIATATNQPHMISVPELKRATLGEMSMDDGHCMSVILRGSSALNVARPSSSSLVSFVHVDTMKVAEAQGQGVGHEEKPPPHPYAPQRPSYPHTAPSSSALVSCCICIRCIGCAARRVESHSCRCFSLRADISRALCLFLHGLVLFHALIKLCFCIAVARPEAEQLPRHTIDGSMTLRGACVGCASDEPLHLQRLQSSLLLFILALVVA